MLNQAFFIQDLHNCLDTTNLHAQSMQSYLKLLDYKIIT